MTRKQREEVKAEEEAATSAGVGAEREDRRAESGRARARKRGGKAGGCKDKSVT